MMRRGPLAQYPAEWVLRQAGATAASGSLEFHTDRPLTLYLRSGRVCHGIEGVPASGLAPDPTDHDAPDEATDRDRVVDLLALALRATEGWYYLDPIGHHTDGSPWRWETASLIMDARIRVHAHEAGPPADAPIEPATAPVAAPPADAAPDRAVELLVPADDRTIALSADAWRLTCALAAPGAATALQASLGWSAERVDGALADLAAAGVLQGADSAPAPAAAAPVAPVPEAAPPAPIATPVPAPSPPVNPVAAVRPASAAATVAVDDRRGALRRLISVLKPA